MFDALAAVLVHFVDDEASVREALAFLLHTSGLCSASYASGAAFLQVVKGHALRGCIVLDVRMAPMSGLQVHDELIANGNRLPVIFLSGHGDIDIAVQALKKGAFDFVEKPFVGNRLVQRIELALAAEAQAHAAHDAMQLQRDKLARLTPRENEVMQRMVAGALNKVIADELGVAMRTVEVHRARVFEKLGLRSSAEVATMLERLRVAA